jgi:chorismate-pyruvate lyase
MTEASAIDGGACAPHPHAVAYVAQARAPAQLKPVDLRALTPYHRALLAMDGTLTHFVEAFHGEPLNGVAIRHKTARLAAYDEWLEAPPGIPVVERKAALTGAVSSRLYAYAESRIVTDRLPPCLRGAIDGSGELLGRIMRACRVETFREMLWYGLEYPVELPETLSAQTATQFLTRAYQIVAGGRPLMVITEKFPLPDDDEHPPS